MSSGSVGVRRHRLWQWAGVLAAGLVVGWGAQVRAQGNSAALVPPLPVADACKRDVMKYQANIDLVRRSLGDKAADELEGRFMPRQQWDALLLTEGYCGIARRLREHRLTR